MFAMAGGAPVQRKDKVENIPVESESSDKVRKNFPESWIWLNDVTG